MRDPRRFLSRILLWGGFLVWMAGFGFGAHAAPFPAGHARGYVSELPSGAVLAKKDASNGRSGAGYGADRGAWRDRYQEWESLSPEEKQRIRKRYEKYKNLPPQERQLYEKRYRQWERLTPEQKKRVEESLRNWDRLTPQERESVRRLFLK
ncbi:MAG: hypothetical protein JG766_409 [Desulfacinum sp.]|nr:hypothetical protein [Desulfacinum sp.]